MNFLNHALKAHSWGANVTAVFEKNPGHTWKTWETKRQTVDDVKALVTSKKKVPIWPIAHGWGVVCGPGGWRYFDLDHAPDPDPAYYLLDKLGLPQNYPWFVHSGSGSGWGVWVICNDDLPAGSLVESDKKGVFWGLPISDRFKLDHIELRWSNCQTVLPPSNHPTGPGYKWVNGQPDQPPAVVTVGDILSAFYAVAVPKAPKVEEKPQPQRKPRTRTNGRGDDLREEIKANLDVLAVAETLFPGKTKTEPTGEIRILGHGGLLVDQDKQVWHDFADTIGGDVFSLIGYEKYGTRWDDRDREMFSYALRKAGELAGIEVPTNGRPVRVNGNGSGPEDSPGWGNYLLDEEATDEGNAQCIVKMFPNQFIAADAFGWLFYNGKYWQREQAEGILDRHIVTMLTERRKAAVAAGVDDNGNWLAEHIVRYCKAIAKRLKDCKYNLSSVVMATAAEFDADRDLLNCNNGVVNLRTGELTPHDPSQRFTYCIPVDYVPNADYSLWEDWLLETVAGGRETVKYLQQAVGYSLTGHTSEECLFYVFGPTRAGKGCFTETLLKMLGHPLADEVDFNTFTAQRDHDANNFDLAGLKAARFIAASESNKYQLLNPRRIKLVTGGNGIRCSFKHNPNFFTGHKSPY